MRVLNTSADVKVYDGTNTELTTVTAITTVGFPALVTGGGYFTVSGFGKFLLSKLTDFRAARALAAAAEVADFAVVAPTGVAVGNVIEARFTYKTERYQGELSNNFIGGGHPVVIQTAPLTGITAANIATAVAAAWVLYKAAFVKSTTFFDATASGNNVRTTAATGYESLSISKVELSISAQGSGSYPKTSLVKTVITAGTQGRNLGKFLEESVRVSTAANTRAYGLTDAIDTQVDLRGAYTSFAWSIEANYDEILGNESMDLAPLANHKFLLYLNESTCLDAANGTTSTKAINKLAALVVGVGLPVAAAVAAPISTANYGNVALLNTADAGVATTILFTT